MTLYQSLNMASNRMCQSLYYGLHTCSLLRDLRLGWPLVTLSGCGRMLKEEEEVRDLEWDIGVLFLPPPLSLFPEFLRMRSFSHCAMPL